MLVVERMIESRLLCNNLAYLLECLLATKLELYRFENFFTDVSFSSVY